MLVYVINNNGQPLMPTKRFGKVRRLLKDGKAKIVNRCPFTIKLKYHAEENVQPISLGVDAGSKYIGISATTEDEVLYDAEIEVRNDISKNKAILANFFGIPDALASWECQVQKSEAK